MRMSLWDVKMHRFPQDEQIYEKWLEAIKNPKFHGMEQSVIRRSYRVCHKHFGHEALIEQGRWGSNLTFTAVPTLYLKQTEGASATCTERDNFSTSPTYEMPRFLDPTNDAIGSSATCTQRENISTPATSEIPAVQDTTNYAIGSSATCTQRENISTPATSEMPAVQDTTDYAIACSSNSTKISVTCATTTYDPGTSRKGIRYRDSILKAAGKTRV